MDFTHLTHLARAATSLVRGQQVVFCGLAAALQVVEDPSQRLRQRLENLAYIELIVIEQQAPAAATGLVNATLGPDTAFHRHFGYCAQAVLPWAAVLPPQWTRRLRRLRFSFQHEPDIFVISAADLVLSRMAQAPDPLLDMELAMKGAVSVLELETLLASWALPPAPEVASREAIAAQIRALSGTLTRLDVFTRDPGASGASTSSVRSIVGPTAANESHGEEAAPLQ